MIQRPLVTRASRCGHQRGWSALLLLCLCACGQDEGPLELSSTRLRSVVRDQVVPGATSAERFGGGMPGAPSGGAPVESHQGSAEPEFPFLWVVPEGWVSLPAAQFREINLQPAGHPDAECYLTALPGSAGGLGANLNRWRGQMGLDPIGAEELVALPTRPLIGAEATFVELEGSFGGMDGTTIADAKLAGLVLALPEFTLFVKMIGPRDVVDAELEGFHTFCSSLRLKSSVADGGGGHDHSHAAGGSEQQAAGVSWLVPAGWQTQPERPMRLVSYAAGTSGLTECYLSEAGGGVLANINRWLGQVGNPQLDAAGLAALPRLDVLGTQAILVEVSGTFRGMSGEERPETSLLGVVVERDGPSLFIKMVGPRAEVSSLRSDFLGLVGSLHPAH